MTPIIPNAQQTGDVHISEYLRIIIYRRRIFLLVFLAVFLGTAIYTFAIKPVYEAFTTLQVISQKSGKGDMLAEFGGNTGNSVDTEIEIIKSRSVAEQAVKRLDNGAAALSPDTLSDRADWLRGGVKAMEVAGKTGIIRLSYQDTDPRRARDVVNTVAQAYIERNIAFKNQEASKTLEFIEEQLTATRNDLDSAEKNLQNYRSSSGAVKLDAAAADLVRKLAEFDGQLSAITLQKHQIEYNITALREAIRKGAVHNPTAPLKDDGAVTAMAARLAELDVQRRTLLAELGDKHPQVKGLKDQIDEVQAKMLTTYEAGLKGLARQEAAIKQEAGRYEGEFRKLPEAERELARLMRLTKVNDNIYTFLLQKHEESRITKAATISSTTVVDSATTPKTPIKPNRRKNLLIGLLIGLMLGVGVALFVEYLDDTIKDAEEARRIIGAPVLGTIPFIPSDEVGQEGDLHASLISHLRPKSAISEAFRSLRTSLHFSAITREKKVGLVTSTFPGEGKTTVSANFAITLAQTGARVLVIDGDLRRPSLHVKFGHSKVPGLAEVLAGDVRAGDILHNTGIPNLMLLTAGTTPPNPAELLGSERMAELLTELREQFDHIVIDAPPVLAVTDAPMLTTRCDVVVIVVEAERVPVKAAQRMAEMLANVQAPVAGIVINDKTGAGMERYGYYGRRYSGYGYGYSDGSYYVEDEQIQAYRAGKRKNKVWWKRMLRR